MKYPAPEAGLVIRYSYLWHSEFLEGREEGTKDRPAAIILTKEDEAGRVIVTTLPITHTPPTHPKTALEIPQITKRRLGLDGARSWVVLSEANRFVWPGPDLRPLPGQAFSTIYYGALPPNFFDTLRQKYVSVIKEFRAKIVQRSE